MRSRGPQTGVAAGWEATPAPRVGAPGRASNRRRASPLVKGTSGNTSALSLCAGRKSTAGAPQDVHSSFLLESLWESSECPWPSRPTRSFVLNQCPGLFEFTSYGVALCGRRGSGRESVARALGAFRAARSQTCTHKSQATLCRARGTGRCEKRGSVLLEGWGGSPPTPVRNAGSDLQGACREHLA